MISTLDYKESGLEHVSAPYSLLLATK
jgi:hypothetical protein